MTTFDIVTPSYGPDFERCRYLCGSIDRFVTGHARHRIVVASRDRNLFRRLEGPNRNVIVAEDILPGWLRSTSFSIGPLKRTLWVSLRARPVHGWHIQQVAKMALAGTSESDAVLFADSDVLFVRPFDLGALAPSGRLRLFRTTVGITADMPNHLTWARTASRLLGLDDEPLPALDHIGHLIAWRRDTARALCARMEEVTGTDWVTALLRARSISEYLIYGQYVDRLGRDRHAHAATTEPLCQSYWDLRPLEPAGIARLLATMAPSQVAVSVSSASLTPFRSLLDSLPAQETAAAVG